MAEVEQVVTEQPQVEDTSAGTATPVAPADTASAAPQPKPETKTFTQDEVNEIVEKRVARAKRAQERDLDSVVSAKVAAAIQQHQPKPQTADPQAPKRDDFLTDEAYLDARIDYAADQKVRQRTEAESRAAQERQAQEREKTVTDRYSDAVAKAAANYEDFEDGFIALQRMPIPNGVALQLREAIAESDVAPQLLHHLATNPQDVQRIAQLSPARAAAELGKLETKLAANPAPASASTPAPAKPASVSKAPEPIEPLGGKAGTTGNTPPSDPNEYKAWRENQFREARAGKRT